MTPTRTDKGHDGARATVTLEFKKNAPLAALAGSHSRHLVRLEHKLGVRIAMRGNLISIEGEPRAREQAAAVLRSLYGRAEAGEEIGPPDIDAEIGFAGEDQRDIVRSTASGLRTAAGKNTRPRTAA